MLAALQALPPISENKKLLVISDHLWKLQKKKRQFCF